MKNQTVYMGLFLMALALYGSELSKKSQSLKKGFTANAAESTSESLLAADLLQHPGSVSLDRLFQRLSQNPFFTTQADGLKLKRTADQVVVHFYGDDVYQDGHFAIREEWHPLLDGIANLISSDLTRGLKIQIRGYADSESPNEKKPSDYGQSDFAFSFARAEWLARYFEKKWQIRLHPQFELLGMGATEGGKMLEIIFSL